MFGVLTLLSGIVSAILEAGSSASKWEIVLSDQLARWAMNGINFFMIFWATNYTKFGGKNGVLGLVYLAGVYCVMGFSEWAWNQWDQDFQNWWLELIGASNSEWDTPLASLFVVIAWVVAIFVQKIIRKN